MQAEGDDLVVRIMADVGPAEPRNVAPRTPVLRDLLGLHPERPVIFTNVADPAEPQPGKAARTKIAGDMEKRAVEGIEIFADLLDQ